MKWFKLVGLITLVLFCGLLWSKLSTKSYLPIAKRLMAKEHRDSTGFDSLYCLKAELSENEYRDAVQKLGLADAENDYKLDASPSNCSVAWWDIEFPSEAAAFKRGENGNTRELAAYKNGYFFYASEVR
jgi:hypothetical protein